MKFLSKVNLPFVDQTNGDVKLYDLAVLRDWNSSKSIETVLVEIRK